MLQNVPDRAVTYGHLLSKYFTAPLGMEDTVVKLSKEQATRAQEVPLFLGDDRAPEATSDTAVETGRVPMTRWNNRVGDDGSALAGALGVKSTLADLMKVAHANLAADGSALSAKKARGPSRCTGDATLWLCSVAYVAPACARHVNRTAPGCAHRTVTMFIYAICINKPQCRCRCRRR
jgi:CubicO group peptidase (beta-lactamase class C family)